MCVLCGQLFCPTNCPAYDPAYDPWVEGVCEECGTALYQEGATVCERCRGAAMKNEGVAHSATGYSGDDRRRRDMPFSTRERLYLRDLLWVERTR